MSASEPPQPGPCLGRADVERVAAGGEPTAGEAAHLGSCRGCAAALFEARREAEFLGRARGLLGDDLGPIGAPRLAGYRPLGVVSTGAQGVVYRARQESTQRTVAIKVLAAPGAAGREGEGTASATRRRMRAEREVEIIARLRHPNIVAVHESRTIGGEDDNGGGGAVGGGGGRVALVMEYVDGVPLDTWTPPGAQSEPERLRAVLRVFVAVCGAVHYAHLNGVIHRDLKPDNILVTPEGRPVVLDFGIAKLNAVAGGGLRATATGDFAGTPAYASPEQVAGKPDDVDALTDVYSLGVILYRLVCRALPYDLGESIFEAARVINSVEPVAPRERDASIARDLEAVVLRALSKEKGRRYQSAAALGQDVERYLCGEPVEARSESGWYLLRKAVMVNRRRLALAGGAAGVLAVAGVSVGLSLSSARESARLAELRREQARAEHVRARAVTELLREAMPVADPQHPELSRVIGKGLTRLYHRLETGAYADDPEVDQEVRRLWGRVYTGFGNKAVGLIEYAEVSLRHGLVRLREAHPQPEGHQEIASTLHQLAAVLLVRSRFGEAESACREALAMRERLDGAASLATCESRELLARVLLARGDGAGAEREADVALAALGSLPEQRADLLAASMQALKARLRLAAGEHARAEPLLRVALARRLRALPLDDPEVVASLRDAAELADRAPELPLSRELREAWRGAPGLEAGVGEAVGRDIERLSGPARGEGTVLVENGRTDALGRVIRLQGALLGRDNLALVGGLLMQVDAATGEGRLRERAEAALRAAEIAGEKLGPDHFAVLVCIQDAALALAFMGEPERAVDLARRACGVWETVPPAARDPLMTANAHRYLLWFLSLSGRHEQAVEEADRAIGMFAAAVGAEHHTVAFCESIAAQSLLEMGNAPGADRRSERALRLGLASPATPPDQLAHLRFVRAHVLLNLEPERHAEARGMLESAWEEYYRTVGGSFSTQRLLVRHMVEICRREGDGAGERLWAGRLGGPGPEK